VLAQFHATFFYDIVADEIHWMTEGRHYKIDYVTFSRLLGFSDEERGFTYIHDERRAEVRDIAYMLIDRRSADGKVKGLKSFYYILNNLIRHTINPKDGAASDLNGYVRNVLARFAPGGDRLCVPRFMWRELRVAMEDARKGLPYAPYLMFLIERVIGYRFKKDGLHKPYKIEKTHASGASVIARRSLAVVEDILESSHASSHRKKKKKSKIGQWIKTLFSLCTYATDIAYQT
jgi:hypothetical protein